MKEITKILINSSALKPKSSSRSYTVTGDPGAVFSMTITNEDNHYYNFPENTIILNPEEETVPTPAFAATLVRLNPITLDETGIYSNDITFPTVTDDDEYVLTIYPESHYDTKLAMTSSGSFIFATIQQLIDTVITFDLSSTLQDAGDESYGTYPSHYTVSGIDKRITTVPIKSTFSISWALALNDNDFIIAKQPAANDFYFSTTKDTLTADSGTSLELKNITGLSVGMQVSGTGIALDGSSNPAVITKITHGYYDTNNSTTAFPIYKVAKIVDSTDANNPILIDHPGGTVVINTSSTFVADRTLTFKGYGSTAAQIFNGTGFSVSNFKVALTDVSTTVNDTDATGAASLTVFDIASAVGLRDDISTVEGIGISDASTTLVTNISSSTITVDTAFKPENGQTLTFLLASRAATVTGDVTVTSYGSDNLTLKLELDNILTVS